MPDKTTDDQKTYSTGELAQACGTTVRTVQYYDERGLVHPTDLTEGGRRVYTEADAARLRRVLLLKSLGLRLADIRSLLSSDASTTVLRDILVEQDARLAAELEERTRARRRIAAMVAALDATGELPAETVPDMEDIMQEKASVWKGELAPTYKLMLAVGIVLDIAEIGAIAWWAIQGDWRPFAIVMPIVIVVCALLVRAYRKRTAYVCPHCRKVFVPKAGDWFFASHLLATRKVTCTECGEKGWCAEVSIERLASKAEA